MLSLVIANKIDVVKIVVGKLSKLNNNKEPSQTRRWSRLKPTVMVVDKTTRQDNKKQFSEEIGAYVKPSGV